MRVAGPQPLDCLLDFRPIFGAGQLERRAAVNSSGV